MTLDIAGFADITPLDSGGFGSVYRAVRVSTGGTVALKQLDRTVDAAEELVERRLRREIAALVALKGHPNVVQVEEMIVTDGGPVIVMEFMDGGSVAALLRTTSPPVERMAQIGASVAAALAAAHQAGIVHRDVKPHNVLLNSFGQVKLCDFGIAAILKSAEGQTRTSSLSVRYASPEELDDAPDVGPPTDVYSLGATLFHLLHGEPPSFRRPGVPPVVDPSAGAGSGPRASLGRIVDDCLQIDPSARPTAAELQQRLATLESSDDAVTIERGAAPVPCERCAAVNDPNARYCRSCGSPLVAGAVGDATVILPPLAAPWAAETAAGAATAPPSAGNRRVMAWVAGALLVLVVAGVGVWLATGGSSDTASDAASDIDLVTTDVATTDVATTSAAPASATPAVVEVTPTTVAAVEVPSTTIEVPVTGAPVSPVGPPVVSSVSATSVRSDAIDGCGDPTTYQPELAADLRTDTAWMAPGDASGETFIVELVGPASITEVGLIPGYAKFDPCTGTDRFEELRRITAVRWMFDDGTVVEQAVVPAPDYQFIAVPPGLVSSRVSMTIVSTTPPGLERLDHTAVSEVVVR